MTFEKGNKESIKGGLARRTPELRQAWAEQEKLKQLNREGLSINQICKLYKISNRSCHRIVKGT